MTYTIAEYYLSDSFIYAFLAFLVTWFMWNLMFHLYLSVIYNASVFDSYYDIWRRNDGESSPS